MKKLVSVYLVIFLILSCFFPAFASDFYKSDAFTIFPPDVFKKTEIEGTDVAYTVQTEDGKTIYFLIAESDVYGLEPYTAMTDSKYFTDFDESMKEGEFVSIHHYSYMNLIPVFYTLYKTSSNIKAVCALPGYGHMLAIIVLSPLDHDPSPEIEALLEKAFPNK